MFVNSESLVYDIYILEDKKKLWLCWDVCLEQISSQVQYVRRCFLRAHMGIKAKGGQRRPLLSD